MKTYILMGRQGEYEPHSFVVAVSRDHSKVEQVKAQKEAIEAYKKIQKEIYDKAYAMYKEKEKDFYRQNPYPEYLYNMTGIDQKTADENKQAWEEHEVKHDAFFSVVWEECLGKVLNQYGVQRNFIPENYFPDDLIEYSIKEWEEL